MMTAERLDTPLIERLPPLRGRLRANEPMAKFTWFRVGGPAEVLFEPADTDDLALFLAERPADADVTVIGGTSNILIRDGGIPGVVVRLGKPFAGIEAVDNRVTAGAAAADINVARRARDDSIAGLEFLTGIPGTIGGALRMNAGCYGAEIADVFESADAIDGKGERKTLRFADMGFGYRHTAVPPDHIFIAATLRGEAGSAADIAERMEILESRRETTQPIRTRTGGSTFANPDGARAWELIDAVGCRGLRIGGAQVSETHCNFLINTGDATARDIETLGEEVRRRVKAGTGVELHWEIRRIGVEADSNLREVSA